jgi:hypothetical protein
MKILIQMLKSNNFDYIKTLPKTSFKKGGRLI